MIKDLAAVPGKARKVASINLKLRENFCLQSELHDNLLPVIDVGRHVHDRFLRPLKRWHRDDALRLPIVKADAATATAAAATSFQKRNGACNMHCPPPPHSIALKVSK